MFASPFYDRAPETPTRNSQPHLSQRQLTFEKLIKHISMDTVAIVMLIAAALLSLCRDEKAPMSKSRDAAPALRNIRKNAFILASPLHEQKVGNKCSPD
jgi:hypothetical protein